MSINRMYGAKAATKVTDEINKNPNRVIGGLKGHGADSFNMMDSTGREKQVATIAYVQGIEEKLRKLVGLVNEQDVKIRRLSKNAKKMD